MSFLPETRQSGPLPWLVAVLCVVYLLAGVIGHDPWKTEDAVGLAIAQGFHNGGDWLVPAIAGEPWPEAEPLYYWVADLSAGLTKWLLPFHDGARLASALFGALFLAMLGAAARRLYGSDAGWGASLLAVGTLGLLVPMHEAEPAAAVLAASACVYWGVSLQRLKPLQGALLMGIGLGAGFLAGGLVGALPTLTLLAMPLFERRWAVFAIAASLGAVIGGAWPLLLAQHHHAYLEAWWAAESSALTPNEGFSIAHAKLLGWFAWPVLFVAPWAFWRSRKPLASPELGLPLIGVIAGAAWFLTHEARPAAALPLVPPLILLAATGSARLRRGASNAWDWFGMMTLTITMGLVWLGGVAVLTGWPAKIADNAVRLEPGFVAHLSVPALLIALAASAAWLVALLRLPRSPWRVVTRWAAGVAIVWVLLSELWMPWIDYGKTYRPVVAGLRQALPADPGCVSRLNLGAPQRAALDYFAGIRTRWGAKGCNWLVVQGGPQPSAPDGWALAWEGHRPGDANEWLRLYRRTGSESERGR